MSEADIDLILATSRRNVAYLTDHQTAHWTWEHAILHMMEKEYEGWDYLLFAGLPLDTSKKTFLVEYAHREGAILNRGVFADEFYGYWRQGRMPNISGPGICLESPFTRTSVEAAVQAIRDRGLDSATIGVEMSRMSVSVLQQLKDLLPKARFVDVFELLFDVRQIKTPEEIRRLNQAYAVATDVYREVFDMLKVGVSPQDILLREQNLIYERGCSFSFAHIFFGSGGHDIAFTPSSDRRIEPGDVGTLDLGVVYDGYGSDYARMVQVLPDPGVLSKYFPTILKARQAVEQVMKPGANAGDVFLAAARCLEEAGLCASISNAGHGIGLGCHEKPYIVHNSDDIIQVGQTVVIEIYAEVRGVGPILLEDGGVVTENGWERFVDLPLDIVEVS